MIDIGLVINGERVRAGIKLDSSEWASILKRIPIEKVGFLSKKMLGAMSDEKIFFSKNCTLTLFDNDRGGLVVEPNILGVPMSIGGAEYIQNAQWGTTVYFSFFSNVLFKLVVQVFGNWEPAHRFVKASKYWLEEVHKGVTPGYEDQDQDYDDKFRIIYSDAHSELRLTYGGSRGHGALMLTCTCSSVVLPLQVFKKAVFRL